MNNEQLELVKKLTLLNMKLAERTLDISKQLPNLVINRNIDNIYLHCNVILKILGDDDEWRN